MLKELQVKFWKLRLFAALVVAATIATTFMEIVSAQIVPDSTLGNENSRVTPNSNVRGLPATLIEGGATRGVNLFQSFSQFNVGDGQRVYFANPAGIDNILTRVTGNSVSNVLGTLGVNGNANLFFLNPNGIVFGQNSRLDVAGSFLATTADSFDFGNGLEFSAKNPQVAPLLTVNIRPGLQFGNNAGDIQNQSRVGLEVQPGNNLALVGGNVSLESGILNAPGGRIELGGLKEAGTIGIDNNFKLNFPIDVERADVSLSNGARVNVAAGGGGDIAVNARSLNIWGSGLTAGIVSGEFNFKAGNIEINATDSVTLDGTSSTTASSGIINGLLLGSGTAGDITINTGSLNIIGNAQIGSFTNGQGNAGNVTIIAKDKVISSGINSGIASVVAPLGIGNGADINIQAREVSLSNRAQIITNSVGKGDSGNIQIKTDESVIANGSSVISSATFGQGNAGNITINVDDTVKLTNGAQLSSSTFGIGNAGNIKITANDKISLDSSSIFSTVGDRQLGTAVFGQGGDIEINARSLSLDNGAGLSTETYGFALKNQQGEITLADAGKITLNVTEKLDVKGGSQLRSNTYRQGNAGDITINGENAKVNFDEILRDQDGKPIIVNSSPQSSGIFSQLNQTSNDLFIYTNGELSLDSVKFTGDRKAGNLTINAKEFSLTNGAQLSSSTFGIGNAGNIKITADDKVSLDSSSIFSTVGDLELGLIGFGQGGNIEINARSLDLKNGARLITETSGFALKNQHGEITLADAGKITLNVTEKLDVKGGSQLRSNTSGQGNAGDITINGENATVTFNGILRDQDGKPILLNGSPQSSGIFSQLNQTSNDLLIYTNGELSLDSVKFTSDRKAGNLTTNAKEFSLTNGAQLSSSTFGIGNAGNIKITADDKVSLDYSSIFSTVGDLELGLIGFGQGGNIEINARSLSLDNGAYLSTETSGLASGEKLADAGKITLNVTDKLDVKGGAQLRSDTSGQGNAGDITVNAENAKVTFDGILLDQDGNPIPQINGLPQSSGIGSNVQKIDNFTGDRKAGNITVNAKEFSLTNRAILSSSTFGIGNAGNVKIIADDKVSLDSSSIFSSVVTGAVGKGGDIEINARSLDLKKWALNSITSTFGFGNAGNVKVTADDKVSLDNSALFAGTSGEGNAGKVQVRADSISLLKSSYLFTGVIPQEFGGTGGTKSGDDIDIEANSVTLEDASTLEANTFGSGNSGNITIKTQSLSVTDGSSLKAQTYDAGNAGNISIEKLDPNAPSSVIISGFAPYPTLSDGRPGGFSSGLFTTTEDGATGEGGTINVTTDSLRIEKGGVLSARTRSDKQGGSIEVDTNTLDILGGGQILTTAFSGGNAGDIKVQVRDNITIADSDSTYEERKQQLEQAFPNGLYIYTNGKDLAEVVIDPVSPASGIFANTAEGSTGKGGNINIDPQLVTIKDGGSIAANSQGSGQAGNLALTSNRLILDNGTITTATSTTNGGNITLNLQDLLLLRENSKISATAGQEGETGNGGKVTIKTPNGFVVALQDRNNDIVARASEGQGGEINIEAQSIFGFAERKSEPANQTNDIDASSDFGTQGTVNLNTPDVDPASGLNSLPENPIDPSNQIDQGCAAVDEDNASEFKVTGRGGLPPSPDQPLSSNTVWEDIRTTATVPQKLRANTTTNTPKAEANKITPATAWVFNENGEVTLVSSTSKATAEKLGFEPKSCPTR
ncbi:MAG: filamentous hemagglutinin N-terminal domain-containing protein [Richelia sp. RM2_1_2]|nr:filamentous hemagglutinin N-terminal domain-containing protein [Richelia sp. RM2_1_2]